MKPVLLQQFIRFASTYKKTVCIRLLKSILKVVPGWASETI